MTDLATPLTKLTSHRILAIIGFQLALVALLVLLGIQYSWLHNVPHPLSPFFGGVTIDSYVEGISNFDFIGKSAEVPPSIFAVILEVRMKPITPLPRIGKRWMTR